MYINGNECSLSYSDDQKSLQLLYVKINDSDGCLKKVEKKLIKRPGIIDLFTVLT